MMKKLAIKGVLILWMMFVVGDIMAQRKLTPEDIAANTTYFKLENGFKGEGGVVLNKEISQAHFIAFGELHNSRQSALFFNELLIEASKSGFDQLALEVGQHASNVVDRLIDAPENAVSNLSEFLKKYGAKNQKWPIPFIKGLEDAKFLQTSEMLDYELWGLDQEYLYAGPFLFDELMLTMEGKSNYNQIDAARQKALKALSKAKSKTQSCQSLKSMDVKAFFDLFEETNEKAQSIIRGLQKSWEIYCHYEEGRYKQNNTSRIKFMRDNFRRNFQEVQDNKGESPKVIAKMGSYHTTKIKSPLGYEDVGHLINQMAEEQNTKALYIRYLRRYWKGKDKLDSKDYASSRTFLTIGKRDEWALIDLRPLRDKIRSGEITVSKFEKAEIFNYDLMLMAPEDKWVRNNF